MATKEEKKSAFKELEKHAKEIAELRKELNSINDAKESLFNEKDEISTKIRKLINTVRSCRGERDKLTAEVKVMKEKRSKLSDEVKKKIGEAKKLNKERDKVREKHSIRVDPSKLKYEISAMELKIETEGISFQKEQEIMKQIKEKKRQLEELRKVSGVFENIHKMNDDIRERKKEADEIHNAIQQKADKSQKLHEEMIKSSKEIDELKKHEAGWDGKVDEVKTRFNEVNESLQQKLMEMGKMRGKANMAKEEMRHERVDRNEMKLKEKVKAVEEKMRKGGKLTTEDIVLLGSAGADSDIFKENFGEEEKEEKREEETKETEQDAKAIPAQKEEGQKTE